MNKCSDCEWWKDKSWNEQGDCTRYPEYVTRLKNDRCGEFAHMVQEEKPPVAKAPPKHEKKKRGRPPKK